MASDAATDIYGPEGPVLSINCWHEGVLVDAQGRLDKRVR
jgi:hypothetical protein